MEVIATGFAIVVSGLLVAIATIDAETENIPDILNVLLFCFALGYAVTHDALNLVGPLIIGGVVMLQWWWSKGRGMGSGDVPLAISIGFLMPDWFSATLCLALSYVIGGVIAAALLLSGRKKRTDVIPFAPFLVVGVFLTLALKQHFSFLF